MRRSLFSRAFNRLSDLRRRIQAQLTGPERVVAPSFPARAAGKLQILHVGNISNLAYCNAKILNDGGYDNTVVGYDFYHFASCPEWQEATEHGVSKSDIGDDWFPNFWTLPIEARHRPDWFVQGPQYSCILYLCRKGQNSKERLRKARAGMDYQRLKATIFHTTTPGARVLSAAQFEQALNSFNLTEDEQALLKEGRILDEILSRLHLAMAPFYDEATIATVGLPLEPGYADGFFPSDEPFRVFWEGLRAEGALRDYGAEFDLELRSPLPTFPREALPADAAPYRPMVQYWKTVFDQYDVVILYATNVLLGYLADVEYFAYEHGTIRVIPFEDNPVGRMTYLGFQHAAGVFVTNSDYITATQRMSFDDGQAHYLPHTYDVAPLKIFKTRFADVKPTGQVAVFFAPARHDWVSVDPANSKGNDRLVRAIAKVKASGRRNFKVILVDWGPDTNHTRALITRLRVKSFVEWVPPMAKQALWLSYLNAHAVVDQFFISSISGVSYEAMALGRRVITWDDGVAISTFFEEGAPLLAAQTPDQIAERIIQVIDDLDDRAGLGERSSSWIERRHGPEKIREIQNNAFAVRRAIR